MSTSEPHPPHVLDIANSDQCCYCGACLGVCPGGEKRNLFIDEFGYGGWRLDIHEESKCAPCTLCRDACPMNVVDYAALDEQVFSDERNLKHDDLLGSYQATYLGWSLDAERRERAASGGIISEAIAYLFETGRIDGAVALKPGGGGPLDYQALIADSHEEFRGAQGSHYFPLPAMDALGQVMNGKYRSVALVGIPCQVTGLNLARQRMQKLRDRVYCVFGSFCGGTTNFRLLEYLASRLPEEEQSRIRTVRFRDGHWPGNIRVELLDGDERKLSGEERDYQAFPAMLPACLYCADHFNDYADISIGDPWLEDVLQRGDGGYSVVVGRSDRGMEVLNMMVAAGRIQLETLTAERIIESQRGPMDYKKRGLAPRLTLKSLFSANVPTIISARLMKHDWFDYVNAFILLVLIRMAKLDIYWAAINRLPSRWVYIINKPVYVLQKRHNLWARTERKMRRIFART